MKRPRFEGITGNPAAVVLEELEKVRRERPDTATWPQGKRVIWNIPDPRDKTAALLMAKTGVRSNEALNVVVDDLMLKDGFVRFRERKGGTTTMNPVDDETVTALQRLLAINGVNGGPVFQSNKGGQIGRERLRREVREAAVRTGVVENVDEQRWHRKFVPHYYRTIFTSLLRNAVMADHYTRYLRGDGDREVMDLYTKIPREKVRKRYLEHMKPVNL